MLEKNNKLSDSFRLYKNKKSALEGLDIKDDDINLAGESLNIRNCTRSILLGRISQDGLFGSKLSSFLKEVRFSK